MKEYALKYGLNPDQTPARVYTEEGEMPLRVLNGRPGYINFLDALNGWQLVRALAAATGLPAAASFKHVSPAGAAVGLPLEEPLRRSCFVPEEARLTALACAYARARGADRMSSFGDFAILSDVCDEATALLLRHEVSDGVLAPGYSEEALAILRQKRKGGYAILQIDAAYAPPALERRTVYGVVFECARSATPLDESLLARVVTQKKELTSAQKRDLLVALVTARYTQSNSVCYAKNGQAIGVGAGQQSRIHCTRLAADKADAWHLRQHEKTLALPFLPHLPRPQRDNAVELYVGGQAEELLGDGAWQQVFTHRPEALTAQEKRAYLAGIADVALGSDAFFPFGDNIERAVKSGVRCVAQPGGSVRDDAVIAACDAHGVAMAFTGLRLFHH